MFNVCRNASLLLLAALNAEEFHVIVEYISEGIWKSHNHSLAKSAGSERIGKTSIPTASA